MAKELLGAYSTVKRTTADAQKENQLNRSSAEGNEIQKGPIKGGRYKVNVEITEAPVKFCNSGMNERGFSSLRRP